MLSPEACANRIADRLLDSSRIISRRWLDRLDTILLVDRQDVFPGDQLLDHIPDIIAEISNYLRAPAGEAIAANTAVMAKAAELGDLRFEQRASVHQLLREYHLLGTLLEEFVVEEVASMGASADPIGVLQALARIAQAVRVLQQQTVDTFVGRYTHKIATQTGQLRGFTRLVSHEIRQPLGVLQLIAHLLPPGDAQHARLVEMLARNVKQLGDVAGKLERLARLTRATDADSATQQELNLSTLCHDVARQLQDMAASRGVTVSIDDALPKVTTDAARAELAIVNLIANGIKYSDPAKSDRFVRVRRADGATPAIAIEDNGIGIPKSQLSAIFDEFVRAHAGRDEELGAHGLGLGLTIVQESMEAMRGTVTVTSDEGAGTVFVLRWPAATPDATASR